LQIIIVGGGLVGTTLAEKLSGEGHDVSLVEHDLKRAAELSDSLDVQIVEGNGATADTLRRAGAADASLIVATTDSDEVNFVTGRIAASMFKVPRVVVRLRDPAHEEAFQELSRGDAVEIVCVNPEAAAVEKIASLLEVPSALDVASFMDGELLVAGFRITERSEFAERPVSDMKLFFAERPSLVAAIQRGDHALVPHGGEQIRAGDIVYFAIERSDLEGVLELMGAPPKIHHRVMIAGATRIGLDLARRLERSEVRVTLIEPDADQARHAFDALGDTVVITGSVTSEALLHEEEIERVDTFVAVTADDETNLVACLLNKRLGAGRAFALVDNPALANLIGETAIDAIISPRLLAIGLTLQHIPGARVHSMAALLGDRVEVMEAEAVRGSPIVSGKLSEIGLPRGVLVGALRRDGKLLVPHGTDRVEPGDRVLIIATTESAAKLTEFLAH
jgi:trk system potassium uptake protein TrkA